MLTKRSDFLPAFGDLRDEIDRLFDRFFESKPTTTELPGVAGAWTPALDIAEKDDTITIKAEVPGVDPQKIEVTVHGDMLTLSGSKEESHEEKNKNYYRTERRFGSFMRRVQLPTEVDESKVRATYKDGVLQVELTKDTKAQPKRIPVAIAKS